MEGQGEGIKEIWLLAWSQALEPHHGSCDLHNFCNFSCWTFECNLLYTYPCLALARVDLHFYSQKSCLYLLSLVHLRPSVRSEMSGWCIWYVSSHVYIKFIDYICYFFLTPPPLFEAESHVAQTDLKFIMSSRMVLSSWSPLLLPPKG